MSKSLGTLTLDLIAKIGGFTGPLDKAGKSSTKWRQDVESNAKAAGLAMAAGVATAATALTALTVSTVKSASEISRFAQVSNTSTTDFQRLSAGADVVGVSQEKLADIFKDVNDKVGDFLNTGGGELKDFFTNVAPQVGVTADQFRKLSGPEALGLYVSSLEKAGASQADMTFYLEAIANDATLLLPLLRNNAQGFKTFGDAAQAAGAILDDKTIKSAQQMAAATWLFEESAAGLKNQISAALLPTLANFVTNLNDTTVNTVLATRVSEDLAGAFKGLAKFSLGAVAGVHLLALGVKALSDLDNASMKDSSYWERWVPPARIYRTFKNFDTIKETLAGAGVQMDETAQGYAKLLASFDEPADPKATNQVKELADLLEQLRNPPKGPAKLVVASPADQSAAKKLLDTVNDTATGYERQIALINTTTDAQENATEADKLHFEIASGKLVGINAQQQKRLELLAAELDAKVKLKKANEDEARAAAFAANLGTENQGIRFGFDQELAGAGMGDKARERLQADLEIREEFYRKQADLFQQYNAKEISPELYAKETDALSEALAERLVIQQDHYNKLDAQQSEWISGAEKAWANYSDSAQNLSAQMYDVTSNALRSLEDELVDFVKTGQFSFSDLASGIADDLLHMLVKVGLQMAVNAAIGETAAASSAAMAAATGTAMAAAYAPAAAMASLASFGANSVPAAAAITSTTALASSLSLLGMAHDGIDSVPETGTWLLQKGERVTTASTSAKLDKTLDNLGGSSSSSGSGVTVSQTFHVNGDVSQQTLQLMAEMSAKAVKQAVLAVHNDARTNGPVTQQMRKSIR